MKKLFGSINLKWPRLIAFAVIAGVYTGIMVNADLNPDGKNEADPGVSGRREVCLFSQDLQGLLPDRKDHRSVKERMT